MGVPPPLSCQAPSLNLRETQKYYSSSSLNLYCLLKATKFLVKISRFEFLVMPEKNIFVYELFFVFKHFRF